MPVYKTEISEAELKNINDKVIRKQVSYEEMDPI